MRKRRGRSLNARSGSSKKKRTELFFFSFFIAGLFEALILSCYDSFRLQFPSRERDEKYAPLEAVGVGAKALFVRVEELGGGE